MSASATFELITDVNPQIVAEEVSILWSGSCYYTSVYQYPSYGSEVFCNLEYFFGRPEEEKMLRNVVGYLLGIASKHGIYYYRCADFAPSRCRSIPVLEITMDNLFQDDLKPSLDAFIEHKFLIYGA